MENLRNLLLGNYALTKEYLNDNNIKLSEILDCVDRESDTNAKIKMLRKADVIFPKNYDIIRKLMYVHLDNREFKEAQLDAFVLEKSSNQHGKETYRLIKALRTYYNVLARPVAPDVYEMGLDFKDSYKKWDSINSQMFSENPYVHLVYEEINRVIFERYMRDMDYEDNFDSIMEKLYYEGFTITVRAELCIYLKRLGLSEYQDFFMRLFLNKDEDIIEYLDSVIRFFKINAGEIFNELKETIKNKEVKKARYYSALLNLLPDKDYSESDKKLNKFLVNRLERELSEVEYKDMRVDGGLEKTIKDLAKNHKRYVKNVSDKTTMAKIAYLLDEYGIIYDYTYQNGMFNVVYNTTEKTYYEDDASDTILERTKKLTKELDKLKNK